MWHGALTAEIAGDLIDGPLGSRERDVPQGLAGQGIEARQAEREVSAALRRDHRMDLVHDHRLDGLEHGAPARTGQQDIKGFRGCDQDVSGERRMRRRSAAGVSPMRTPAGSRCRHTPAARSRGRCPKETFCTGVCTDHDSGGAEAVLQEPDHAGPRDLLAALAAAYAVGDRCGDA
jgi:hypothetical protein